MSSWRSAGVAVGLAVWLAGPAIAELRVPELQAKHAAIEKPAPDLSVAARQLKISGHVELTVKIDEAGAVSDVKIESGNAVLTAGCVTAVKKWKFKPFTQDGKPVAAITTLTFDFKQ
jgi:protein TonB